MFVIRLCGQCLYCTPSHSFVFFYILQYYCYQMSLDLFKIRISGEMTAWASLVAGFNLWRISLDRKVLFN